MRYVDCLLKSLFLGRMLRKKQQLLSPQAVLLKLEMAYLAMQDHVIDQYKK